MSVIGRMNGAREPASVPEEPRRRFLRLLAVGLGGAGAVVLGRQLGSAASAPEPLPLKEADFYQPHNLAG